MPKYPEGTKANGYVVKKGEWVVDNGGSAGGGRVEQTDETALNKANETAATSREAQIAIANTRAALKRLPTGPFRGALYDAALPEEGGGFLDKLGAFAIGGPARILGAITDQNVADLQTVSRAKQIAANAELRQNKGTQTEGDAARAMLVGVSPYKVHEVNDATADQATAMAQRGIDRPSFYAQWIKKYGKLGAPNEQGQGVEPAYQAAYQAAQQHKPVVTKSGITITRIK